MREFVRVASTADVSPGQIVRVWVEDTAVALYNVDGEFYATSDECSHAVASLSEGKLDGHVVECPRHFARFDVRTGKNLRFPAVVPIKSFPVKVEGDDVLVSVA